MSCSEVNPEIWPSFCEERRSNFLFIYIYIDNGYSDVNGLVLRRLSRSAEEATYVRMGVFFSFDGYLSDLLSATLEYPSGHSILEDIDLDDVGLADFVHTVTIV